MSRIYLIGFMGAGKTSVGALLAERLGIPFVDIDANIERSEGMSVAAIFETEGEAAFRALESAAIARAAEGPSAVVSCGGGAIADPSNRERMRASGTIVLLDVTAEEAVRRLGGDGSRPLLAGDPLAEATRLHEQRRALYEGSADVRVDTVGRTPEQVAEDIAAALRDAPVRGGAS